MKREHENPTFCYGKVCEKHPELEGERYKSSRGCPACNKARHQTPERKEYDKARRQTPEYKEYEKARQQTPERKEYIRKYMKARHQTPERKEYEKARQQTPKYKEYNKARRQTPEYKARHNARTAARRAMKRYWWDKLTEVEQLRVTMIYLECQLKNDAAGFIKYHVDHKDALVNGGPHHPDNLHIIEAVKNLSKGAKDVHPLCSMTF